jgi:hypothetical protein
MKRAFLLFSLLRGDAATLSNIALERGVSSSGVRRCRL